MTRLPLALVLFAMASAAHAQPVFNHAGDMTARDLTLRSINGAATVGSTSLATIVAQAAAALPAAQLSAATPMPLLALASRSLASRFSDSLNVRDYGAKCDGVTDDTAAFQAAIAVATGQVPVGGISAQFASIVGVGPNPNGSAKIVVPSGACMLSATLTANMLANAGFSIVGDGTSNTELVWTMSGDGLDINFAANAGGNDIVHDPATGYAGQALFIKGIKFVTAYNNAANPGVALNIKGIPLVYANVSPTQVIEDVAFTNRAGWIGSTQGWAVGLRFLDPDFLYIKRAIAVDLRQTRLAGFQIVSDATGTNDGHGNIICEDCTSYGGSSFFSVVGQRIQAIWLERPFWVATTTGVTWLSALQATNGSLSIHGASGGAIQDSIHVSNIGTIFLQGNFFYTFNAVANVNWHAVWLDGVDWVNEVGDTITAPPAGSLGTGRSYGVLLNQGASGAGVYDPLPTLINNVSVAGSDYSFSAQGPNVMVQGGICAPNTSNGLTTSCFQDIYTGTDVRFHPHFLHMVTTDNLVYAEAGHDVVVHGAYNQMFGSGIDVGMPGITIPAVGVGGAGFVDLHSIASSDGSIAKLNDYDCRETVSGGVSGTAGLGTLYDYCKGGLVTNGGIVDGSSVPVAATAAVTITATDNTGGQLLICASSGTTLASLTEVLPANPRPKQTFHVAAECTITALAVTGGTSSAGVAATVLGAPAGISATTPVTFVFDNDRAIWTRW